VLFWPLLGFNTPVQCPTECWKSLSTLLVSVLRVIDPFSTPYIPCYRSIDLLPRFVLSSFFLCFLRFLTQIFELESYELDFLFSWLKLSNYNLFLPLLSLKICQIVKCAWLPWANLILWSKYVLPIVWSSSWRFSNFSYLDFKTL
jgi:hypothetical protein